MIKIDKIIDVLEQYKGDKAFQEGEIFFNLKTKKVCKVSRTFSSLSGYFLKDFSKISAKECIELIIPPDDNPDVNLYERLFKNFEPVNLRVNFFTKDNGLIKALIVSSVTFEDGGASTLCCSFLNLEELDKDSSNPYSTALQQLKTITMSMPGGIFTVKANRELELVYANDFFFSVFHTTRTDFYKKYMNKLSGILHPHDVDNVYYTLSDSKHVNKSVSTKARMINELGEIRWLSINAYNSSVDGDGVGICQCVVIDETDTMKIMFEIETSRREIEAIANSTPGSISKMIYKEGKISYNFLSNGLHHAAGYTYEDDVFDSVEAIIVPEDREATIKSIDEQLEYSGFTVVYRIINKGGSYSWVRQSGSLLDVNENGEYTFICVYIDISNIKELQIETEREKERLGRLLDSTGDILFEYNIANDMIRFTDRKMLELGKNDNWYVYNFTEKTSKDGFVIAEQFEKFLDVLSGKAPGDLEIQIKNARHPDNYNWYLMRNAVLNDKSGASTQVFGILRDIQMQKNAELELITNEKLDSVTMLLNFENVQLMVIDITSKQASGTNNAMLLINIDGFSDINNTMGFTFGNNMLKSFADILKKSFDEKCVVGRVWNDHFIVFMPYIQAENEAIAVINKVCKKYNSAFSDNRRNSTISAGLSYSPVDGIGFSDLFYAAETALKEAKKQGGNMILSYNSEMSARNQRNVVDTKNEAGDLSALTLPPSQTFITVNDILMSTSNVGEAMEKVMEIIGKRFKINRILVFENISMGRTAELTYKWSSKKIPVTCTDVEIYNEFNELRSQSLFQSGLLMLDSIDLYKELPEVYTDMYESGVYKVMQLISCKELPLECWVRFEFSKSYTILRDDARLLSNLIFLISSYVTKARNQQLIRYDDYLSELLIKQAMLFVYIIDLSTYKIKHIFRGIPNYKPNAKVGQLCYEVIKNRNKPCENCPLQGFHSTDERHTMRMFDIDTGLWMDVTASRIKSPNEDSVIVSCYNISQYISRISDIDQLTCAPTLNYFEKVAKETLNNNISKHFRILFMEFSSINKINDTYGYKKGDLAIIAMAGALAKHIHGDSCFGRVSSNKFAVLRRVPSETSSFKAKMDLKNFRAEIVESLKDIINPSYVSITVGVYDIKSNTEIVMDAIEKAHIAQKNILVSEPASFFIYNSNLEEKGMQNQIIESNMEKALANKEFKVFLQPRFDLKTNEITGAEALVRWITQNNVTIYPSDFIPIFEKNGFIIKLDFYVYEQVFIQMKSWLNSGRTPMPVAINISGAHIGDVHFIIDLMNLVNKYGIPHEYIELEISERVFASNTSEVIEVIAQLTEIGFKVTVDDFGSMFTSLGALGDINANIIKLDKEFFSKAVQKNDTKLMQGLVTMARLLDLKVIAVGVETQEQLKYLKTIECKDVQGYLFAKPLPTDLFDKMYMQTVNSNLDKS